MSYVFVPLTTGGQGFRPPVGRSAFVQAVGPACFVGGGPMTSSLLTAPGIAVKQTSRPLIHSVKVRTHL